MSIDFEKWRQFWSPSSNVAVLRGLVANPHQWEFERRVHTDLLFRATTDPLLRSVVEPADYAREVELSLVEIGVGVGRIAGPLSERRWPRIVTGVDVSDAMLAECAKDWPRVIRKPVPVEGAPWGEEIARVRPADVVYSLLCLQHVPTKYLVNDHLAQACHALRQHGVLRVQTLRAPPNPCLDSPAFHGATFATLADFAEAVQWVGLSVVEAVAGLGHPDWLWITAVKP